MAVMHILLTTKLKLKEKLDLIYKLIFLLAMKQKINKKFEMIAKFLSKKTLSLMNQSFNIRIREAQN